MDAQEKAAVEINEQREKLRSILNGSPLYLDRSFLERKNFLRYLVAIVLHE